MDYPKGPDSRMITAVVVVSIILVIGFFVFLSLA